MWSGGGHGVDVGADGSADEKDVCDANVRDVDGVDVEANAKHVNAVDASWLLVHHLMKRWRRPQRQRQLLQQPPSLSKCRPPKKRKRMTMNQSLILGHFQIRFHSNPVPALNPLYYVNLNEIVSANHKLELFQIYNIVN